MAVHEDSAALLDHDGGQTGGFGLLRSHADKIGRRWLLIFTIAGVGVMSLIAGFLPTYAQLGDGPTSSSVFFDS